MTCHLGSRFVISLIPRSLTAKEDFTLPRTFRLGWLALGLMLFAAACAALGDALPSATPLDGTSTSTRVAQTEASATSTVAGPVESAAEEDLATETPTARLVDTPPTIHSPSTETPVTSVGNPTPEVEATPQKTPTVTVEAEAEEVTSDKAEADRRPTEEQLRLLTSLESYGPAPELHNEVWLNSEPRNLADLRGKVVMVEFWTFG